MTATARPSRARSVGAIAAGFALTFVLSVLTDAVLHAAGVFAPYGQPSSDASFVLAIAYRTVFTIAGAALTARMAPERPLQHARTLGLIGLMLSTVGLVATWNAGPAFGPHWYPVTLLLLVVPSIWSGALLGARRA